MRCRSAERVAHSRVKFQPRVDETLLWKVPTDLADPTDPGNPADQVSSAAGSNHSNTRAGGEDYVSSNQTPSNEYMPALLELKGLWAASGPFYRKSLITCLGFKAYQVIQK